MTTADTPIFPSDLMTMLGIKHSIMPLFPKREEP